MRLTWLALAFLVLGTTGCISEAPGSQVWGVNESDHDVIVTSLHHGGTYVLPARTWGRMFDSYEPPSREIRVYDTTCRLLTTAPLTGALQTVHVPPTGGPVMTGEYPDEVPMSVDTMLGPGSDASFAPATCD